MLGNRTRPYRTTISRAFILCPALIGALLGQSTDRVQIQPRTPCLARAAANGIQAHNSSLRFYRYKTTHVDAEGSRSEQWSGWHLIVSKPQDAKLEIEHDLAWFKEVGIAVQYALIEGVLPE
jgi:hypothetical protein